MSLPQPSLPLSPPAEVDDVEDLLDSSHTFLRAQAQAIQLLSDSFSPANRLEGPCTHFSKSLQIMRQTVCAGGTIIFSGMGKSHKIGAKLAATLQSFGILSSLLHASEALHGDVGIVRPNDTVVLISASGNSPELAEMIKHIPKQTATICLTCNENSSLAAETNSIIFAPIESYHSEQNLYGLPAPTISSTMCLVLGDAICLALFESVERDTKRRQSSFARNHPGGAIGIANKKITSDPISIAGESEDEVILWDQIPYFESDLSFCSVIDVWKAVNNSPYLLVNSFLYKSSDIVRAVELGEDLASVPHYSILNIPSLTDANIEVYRDESNRPIGVLRPICTMQS
ncbi:hypothetical protein DASB73_037560 [Starmerella bacillaris]|uniref:SIS domain-containing protein n=1 Tax=Starmerella bacillaris TaxID=1247836 RepID=A0AAV5RNR3_STABA|nr:hypothetical protein DASB73_037560 [Starmerella bacillaris]